MVAAFATAAKKKMRISAMRQRRIVRIDYQGMWDSFRFVGLLIAHARSVGNVAYSLIRFTIIQIIRKTRVERSIPLPPLFP